MATLTILDSGQSLDLSQATADRLLAEGLIYYCGEPEGVCCYVPNDCACGFYHIHRDRLEKEHGIDFVDDEAGWRFIEQRVAEYEKEA